VKEVFVERLRATLPLRAERIVERVREARGGRLNDPRFSTRQRGEGPYAEAAQALFRATARRLGLSTDDPPGDSPSTFVRPRPAGPRDLQLKLL
jgi:hypothetical protein